MEEIVGGRALIELFFYLLVGHAVADFALQPDSMGKGKNRNRKIDRSAIPPGQKYVACWPYWLTAHALVHGGAVAVITGVWWLGLIETAAHWTIDFCKCDNKITVHQDQSLHIGCKIVYLPLLLIT